jgi:hypothetical protein
MRQLPGIQDGFNRKGLLSDQGERKQAFFILQKTYRDWAIHGPTVSVSPPLVQEPKDGSPSSARVSQAITKPPE